MTRKVRGLDRGIDPRLACEVRKLEPATGQRCRIGERGPDQVLDTSRACFFYRRGADLCLLRHLRRVPEVRDEKDTVSAVEGRSQGVRLEQIPLHDLNAALLQRLCRRVDWVATDDAHRV